MKQTQCGQWQVEGLTFKIHILQQITDFVDGQQSNMNLLVSVNDQD